VVVGVVIGVVIFVVFLCSVVYILVVWVLHVRITMINNFFMNVNRRLKIYCLRI
jgi:hypothetical protein